MHITFDARSFKSGLPLMKATNHVCKKTFYEMIDMHYGWAAEAAQFMQMDSLAASLLVSLGLANKFPHYLNALALLIFDRFNRKSRWSFSEWRVNQIRKAGRRPFSFWPEALARSLWERRCFGFKSQLSRTEPSGFVCIFLSVQVYAREWVISRRKTIGIVAAPALTKTHRQDAQRN